METPEGGDGKKGPAQRRARCRSPLYLTPLSSFLTHGLHPLFFLPGTFSEPDPITPETATVGGGGDGTGHNRRKWAPIFPVLSI